MVVHVRSILPTANTSIWFRRELAPGEGMQEEEEDSSVIMTDFVFMSVLNGSYIVLGAWRIKSVKLPGEMIQTFAFTRNVSLVNVWETSGYHCMCERVLSIFTPCAF